MHFGLTWKLRKRIYHYWTIDIIGRLIFVFCILCCCYVIHIRRLLIYVFSHWRNKEPNRNRFNNFMTTLIFDIGLINYWNNEILLVLNDGNQQTVFVCVYFDIRNLKPKKRTNKKIDVQCKKKWVSTRYENINCVYKFAINKIISSVSVINML